MLRPTVSRPVCLPVKPYLGPNTRFLLLSDSYGFVNFILSNIYSFGSYLTGNILRLHYKDQLVNAV
jgi:hypothetical protein